MQEKSKRKLLNKHFKSLPGKTSVDFKTMYCNSNLFHGVYSHEGEASPRRTLRGALRVPFLILEGQTAPQNSFVNILLVDSNPNILF